MDLKELGKKGIAVCTVPDYGTTEVADHAMALMLMMRRGLDQYDALMRKNANQTLFITLEKMISYTKILSPT